MLPARPVTSRTGSAPSFSQEGDPLEQVVRDTAFVQRAPLDPIRNLTIDSLAPRLRPAVPAPDLPTISLLSRGAVASFQAAQGKPLFQTVFDLAAQEASEQFANEQLLINSQEFADLTEHLDSINLAWGDPTIEKPFVEEYDRQSTSHPTKGIGLPPLQLSYLGEPEGSFPRIIMSQAENPANSDNSHSEDEHISLHAEESGDPMDTGVEHHDIREESPILMPPPPEMTGPSTSKGFGLKRGDRIDAEAPIGEYSDHSIITGASQPKKPRLGLISTSLGLPPGQEQLGSTSENINQLLREQSDVLGSLSTQVGQLINGLGQITDEIRVMKDVIAKQSQMTKDMSLSIEIIKAAAQVSTSVVEGAAGGSGATLSTVRKSVSKEDLVSRERVRIYYQQKIRPLKLRNLTEALMVDMWSAISGSRKSLFLARFPGIEWSEAIEKVIVASADLTDVILKQADTELAAYLISQRNKGPTPPSGPTPQGRSANVVMGLTTPAPATVSLAAQYKATGAPVFSFRNRLAKQ